MAKKKKRKDYDIVFINGKQKRVKRPPTVDGMPVGEFLRRNNAAGLLLEFGMYDVLYEMEQKQQQEEPSPPRQRPVGPLGDEDDLPF